MVITFISILAIVIVGFCICNFFDEFDFIYFIGMLTIIIGVLGLIIYACLIFDYVASKYKVKIINKEYGTNYTREEVFYASSVMDIIRELDRERIELNGDLMKK